MSDSISVSLEDVTKVADKFPDSYFAGAASFGKLQGKTEVEICTNGLKYMYIANPTAIVEDMDMLNINKDALARAMLTCILEINKDSLDVVEQYVAEMVRLDMYEEFQKYVFSQIDDYKILTIHDRVKFSVEFLTAYPYRSKLGRTMLMYFAEKGDLNMCCKLLGSGKAEPDCVDQNGYTALIYACEPEPDCVDQNGYTAFIYACKDEHSKIALAILETGQANIGQINKFGVTAFKAACGANMPEVALQILKTGQANPGQADVDNVTALMYTCFHNMPQVALAILETGQGNPGCVDHDGVTALIEACQHNMSEVALAILATGQGKPRHIDKNGNSALSWAFKNRMCNEVLRILIMPTN